MRRLLLGLCVLVAGHYTAAADTSSQKNLPVMGLADLVVAALPPDGFDNLGWDYMVGSPMISWKTSGTESTQTHWTRREGVVRVSIAGVESKILRRTWEELAWTITLWTEGNEKFGPQYIVIQPGSDDAPCFGVKYRGCSFSDTQALDSPKLESHFVCAPQDVGPSDVVKIYSVSTQGKKPSLLVYQYSTGSGGASTSIQIRPLTDKPDVCHVRGWLGVKLQLVTTDIAENLGLKDAAGAMVTGVNEAGPANKAKIRSGDIILTFNGQNVKDLMDLPRIVAVTQVGTPVPIMLWRDGEKVTVQATLEEKPDTTKPTDLTGFGLKIAPIRPDLQNSYQLSDGQKGVVIVDVAPRTVAAESGFQSGDVIVQVQQREVSTPGEVERQIEAARKENRNSVLMLIQHEGRQFWVPLPVGKDKK